MLTVALESVPDLQAFQNALRKRWRLPRVRIALRLSTLPEVQRDDHERHINRLLMAQGWAEAAASSLLLIGLTAVFPLSPAGADSPEALLAWGSQGLLGAGVGAVVGRLAAQGLARLRLQRLCARIEAELSARP
ncbi:MAG: hypothetical protein H7Z15_15030 [Rhizobacter sp.]|nr:hypothetical protein [Rhizobacter sp.]